MEKDKYIQKANILKALSDSNRLQIVNMLSSGELCACHILEKFNITQPTLSYHMKTLIDNGIVTARKEANWTYYTLNNETMKDITNFLENITKDK